MSIEEFAEILVTNIASDKDLVKVKKFENEDETILEIMVSEKDMPRVIGKDGAVAKSIRNILQSAAYSKKISNLKVNFDAF